MTKSALDSILERHNREMLVGIIGDTYLLLWDLYYQKYRGQALFEDLNRVKIYVKGKSSGGVFSQGIGVDLNKACQLFESFNATNTTNFDMEQDSADVEELDERISSIDPSTQRTSKSKYFANHIITSLPLNYQNFPIDGIHEDEAIGIRDLFFDLRGSIVAIRGPRNRHQHGGLDPKSGELQAAAAAIRVCEIHQHLWAFLEKHSNGWRPLLNDEKHYEFAWDSIRINKLKSHIWENLRHLDVLKHEQVSQPKASSDPEPVEASGSSSSASNPGNHLIVEELKKLQDSIDLLLETPMKFSPKINESLDIISQKTNNIDTKTIEILESIKSLVLAKPENASERTPQPDPSQSRGPDIRPYSAIQSYSPMPAKEALMNLRNEIASQLRTEFPDFKPWHNILMRDLIDHIVLISSDSQLQTSEELKQSLYSTIQVKRIAEMNDNGRKMIDRQIEIYGQKILQILRLPAALASDDEEDVPF